MLKLIKKIVPLPFKKAIARTKIYRQRQLKTNFKKDMTKFKKYSFDFAENKTKRHYEAELIFYYHKIEKGLALPKPRIGFGKKHIKYLCTILEKYVKNYGWDDVSLISLDTLYEYYYFNERNNLRLDSLYKQLKKLEESLNGKERLYIGGVDVVTKKEIEEKAKINFKDFVYSRYSIRDFAPGDINLDTIKEAVYIAQKTPSVCNRQSSKVYVYRDSDLKERILKYQNGNVGFGDKASLILIVTVDLKDFRGVIERNQGYIDGGMYAMSLIYALHSQGLGTCALNLSITNETESQLKKVANIDDSEIPIMMIAVGKIPEKLRVASSPRRSVEEVMTVY